MNWTMKMCDGTPVVLIQVREGTITRIAGLPDDLNVFILDEDLRSVGDEALCDAPLLDMTTFLEEEEDAGTEAAALIEAKIEDDRRGAPVLTRRHRALYDAVLPIYHMLCNQCVPNEMLQLLRVLQVALEESMGEESGAQAIEEARKIRQQRNALTADYLGLRAALRYYLMAYDNRVDPNTIIGLHNGLRDLVGDK